MPDAPPSDSEAGRLRIALIWGAALAEFRLRATELRGDKPFDILDYPRDSRWRSFVEFFELSGVDVTRALRIAGDEADDLIDAFRECHQELAAQRPDGP